MIVSAYTSITINPPGGCAAAAGRGCGASSMPLTPCAWGRSCSATMGPPGARPPRSPNVSRKACRQAIRSQRWGAAREYQASGGPDTRQYQGEHVGRPSDPPAAPSFSDPRHHTSAARRRHDCPRRGRGEGACKQARAIPARAGGRMPFAGPTAGRAVAAGVAVARGVCAAGLRSGNMTRNESRGRRRGRG